MMDGHFSSLLIRPPAFFQAQSIFFFYDHFSIQNANVVAEAAG